MYLVSRKSGPPKIFRLGGNSPPPDPPFQQACMWYQLIDNINRTGNIVSHIHREIREHDSSGIVSLFISHNISIITIQAWLNNLKNI